MSICPERMPAHCPTPPTININETDTFTCPWCGGQYEAMRYRRADRIQWVWKLADIQGHGHDLFAL